MYATLKSSYEWNRINENNILTDRISKLMTEGRVIPLEAMPTAVLQIKNRIRSPLTTKILDAIREQRINMIYAPDIRVPQYLPFVVSLTKNNNVTGFVFINNLDVGGTPETEITINARKLMVSLESCFCSLTFTELGNSPKLRSTALLRTGSSIYSSLISEAINKKHSTKLDPIVHNSVLYLASEYFVGTMIGCFDAGMDETTMRNYCLYNCKTTDYTSLAKVVSEFQREDFENIATFISKLSKVPELEKRLGKLNVSSFLETCLNSYDPAILLGLETFPYFFFNVLAVNEGTYQNNYGALKNIVGENGKKLYADVVTTVNVEEK